MGAPTVDNTTCIYTVITFADAAVYGGVRDQQVEQIAAQILTATPLGLMEKNARKRRCCLIQRKNSSISQRRRSMAAVLRKFSDLAVVGALLVINAVLSFMQEQRAAGVVEALRKRLQVGDQ